MNQTTRKSALVLFGLSYLEDYRHPTGKTATVDYRRSLANYDSTILRFLRRNRGEPDVFLCTNDSPLRAQILKDYRPRRFEFVPEPFIPRLNNYRRRFKAATKSKNRKLLSAFSSMLDFAAEHDIEYDKVIATRFDLHFHKQLTGSNTRTDRLNLVSVLQRPGAICDNFYLMPFRLARPFQQVLRDNLTESHHCIGRDLREISDLHFICEEKVHVRNLSFYSIHRRDAKNSN